MDVDGVLTDGGFWWGANGDEFKRFSFLDVMGVSIGHKAGLLFGLITGENTPFAGRFATKMSITELHTGCKDKAAALRLIAERNSIPLSNICYIGDDINDLPAMELAGLSAAPANAHPEVLDFAKLCLKNCGGNGAVRELIDYILANHRH
jgi:3-deoxy-D-manno-octulosonate 8-phosphate phosphatase (KDO 8-P phosphatase)